MIIPDYRLVPKLECGKLQLSQIYTCIKGITFYLFCPSFIEFGPIFSKDNPKWSFQITDLCQNWNAENFNYLKFILA